MKFISLYFCLICSILSISAQTSIKGKWINTKGFPKLFNFYNSDSISIVKDNKYTIRKFLIKISDEQIELIHNDVVFDTLVILKQEKSELILYHKSVKSEYHLSRSKQKISENKISDFFKNKHLNISVIEIKENKEVEKSYKIIDNNHFLYKIHENTSCELSLSIDSINMNEYGPVINLKIRSLPISFLVMKILNDRIEGISINNGKKIIITELKFNPKIQKLELSNLYGSYVLFSNLAKVKERAKSKSSIIYIGYSRYKFNEDKTFIVNDKNHGQTEETNGIWDILYFDNKSYLEMKRINENNEISYIEYYIINSLNKEYIELFELLCPEDEKIISDFKETDYLQEYYEILGKKILYLKKIGFN